MSDTEEHQHDEEGVPVAVEKSASLSYHSISN